VDTVTFSGTLGSKIIDGADLTFTYSANSVTISNGNSADDQTISVSASDTSFEVSSGNFMGMTVNLSSGQTVSDITSGTDGVTISLSAPTATGTVTVATDNVASVSFGSELGDKITDGADITFTYGSNAITISDGMSANDQTIAVNATDTSFAVGSGNYKGMTVILASGKTVSDLTSGVDAISVSVSTATTGATGTAQFTNHVLTSDAVCTSGIDVTSHAAASSAITAINTAINTVSTQRAQLGALSNRLEHKINNLNNTSENLSAAESRIRDVDMAQEMTVFTQNNILVQAATSMLVQANQGPQNVLKLLQ
jgi:flagellin